MGQIFDNYCLLTLFHLLSLSQSVAVNSLKFSFPGSEPSQYTATSIYNITITIDAIKGTQLTILLNEVKF